MIARFVRVCTIGYVRCFPAALFCGTLLNVAAQSPASDANRELSMQANDPTAPLTQIQIRPIYAPRIPLAGSGGSVMEINTTTPIFRPKGRVQLVKFSMPVLAFSPKPQRDVGLGDLQIFDLLGFQAPFGTWGAGGTLVVPTATSKTLGEGKWQAGPAFGLMVSKIPHLLVGFVAQNPISFAGPSTRDDVNAMSISPTLTYSLPQGWFVGHSDLDMTFNWHDGDDRLVPFGLQMGRVLRIGSNAWSVSGEVAYAAIHPKQKPYPKWLFAFEIILLKPKQLP